jgi:hypothetical protein
MVHILLTLYYAKGLLRWLSQMYARWMYYLRCSSFYMHHWISYCEARPCSLCMCYPCWLWMSLRMNSNCLHKRTVFCILDYSVWHTLSFYKFTLILQCTPRCIVRTFNSTHAAGNGAPYGRESICRYCTANLNRKVHSWQVPGSRNV